MLSLVFALVLGLSPSAFAQTSAQAGGWVDASGGLSVGSDPLHFGPGGQGSLGIWWGNYDDRRALGRSWGLGAALRYEHRSAQPRVAPMLELRRQIDLLVVGLRWRVQAGPEIHGDVLGVGARVGGSAMVRVRPWFGPTLNLDVGAAYVGGQVRPSGLATLGFEGSFRLFDRRRQQERRDAQEQEP